MTTLTRPQWAHPVSWAKWPDDKKSYAMANCIAPTECDKARLIATYALPKGCQSHDYWVIRRKIEGKFLLGLRIGKKQLKKRLRRGWAAYEKRTGLIHPEKMWDDYETHGTPVDYSKTDAKWLLMLETVWQHIGMEMEDDGSYMSRTRAGLLFKNHINPDEYDKAIKKNGGYLKGFGEWVPQYGYKEVIEDGKKLKLLYNHDLKGWIDAA